MKLLIALLFVSSIAMPTFAKRKARKHRVVKNQVDKYFEIGTSIDISKETNTAGTVTSDKENNITLRAAKGYIFNKKWDVSLGVQYKRLAEYKNLGLEPKAYGAKLAVKYIFKKRPSLVKHYHKTWMTPYVGAAYRWIRVSPFGATKASSLKLEEPGYILSVGTRCFMTKNLAATFDLSYIVGKKVITNTINGTEIKNEKTKEINPSLSFVYFY
ncbi:MAG: hypothetical protein HAW60_03195 [Bdellovibrionales bacterium]|nr:hypothetical protein [Bdellovibrionales bacterium]